MPEAIAGMGTQFRRWNSATGLWEKIALITKIGGPDSKRDTQDATSLDTVGGYRTFIGGLRDGGNVKLSMQFSRDTYEVMRADFEDDDLKNYEIALPDNDQTSMEFMGLVTELPLSVDEKIITADVTIKISGPVTINSGSGPSPG
ncbi:MAG: hypothetical protein D4R73_05935 [Deltaproteobacteria bacterium]|nr:MAG: hypothetical protein D4R73_05935 [Deltaproteobacteria bacterium]